MIFGLDVKSKVMWCSICSNEVKSKYYRIDEHDKVICDRCYEKVTRCQLCHLPSFNIQIIDSLRVCSVCYSKKDVCLSCRKLLKGEHRSYINGLQGFFCYSCYNLGKRCSRCSFPALDVSNFKAVDIDLYLCSGCASHSVLTEELASTILSNIQSLLSRQTGINFSKLLLPPATVRLLYRNQMSSFLGKGVKRYSSDQSKALVYSSFKQNSYFIYSLIGLSLSSFISYVTYEYSKLLSSKYCTYGASNSVRAGFSSWLTMKLLFLLGYNDQIDKLSDILSYDSFGFRKIKLIERNRGVRGVIDFVRESQDDKIALL